MEQSPQELFKNNRILGTIDKFLSIVVTYSIILLEKISFGKLDNIFKKVNSNSIVFNNIIGLTIFNALGGLLIIFTQIKLANYLGPSSYGIYSYCLAIGEVGCVIVRYGRSKTMLRDLVQFPAKRNVLISTTFVSGLINLALFLIIVLPLYKVLGFPFTPGCILLIIAPCLISLDFQPVYESIMAMSWHSIYNLIQKILFVTAIWAAFFFSFDISLTFLGCVTFISWIIVIVGEFKEIFGLYKLNIIRDTKIADLKDLYRRNFLIALCNFSWILYQPVIRIILERYSGSGAVGIFSSAFQIMAIFQFIIIQIARVGNPKMSEIGKCVYPKIARIKFIKRYLLIMFLATAPMAIPLLFCSNIITSLFFTSAYNELATLLPIMGIYLLANSLSLVFEQFLISMRKDKYYLFIFTTGAILTLVSALFLIPLLGAKGACISLCISMIYNLISYSFLSKKSLNIKE